MAWRIEDYALVGDLHTAALVSRDGSIDWLCLPRFDSGACFAALLGDEENGHWRIAPCGEHGCTRRAYRGDTLVLETFWNTSTGSVKVIDFMPHRDELPDLVRIVEGLRGEVRMESEVRLRFDYGRIMPWVRRSGHSWTAIAGPDSVRLGTDPRSHTHSAGFRTRSEFTVRAGERVPFTLIWHPSHEPGPPPEDPETALASTIRVWDEWAAGCAYRGPWREAVVRSLITLKALTYRPTGGVVAAATTSLPEVIGGQRNWDYRYCWLRDATLTLAALVRNGYLEEAGAWREWLLRAVAGDPADLRIMYGLAGERRLPEMTLDWLPGYAGSFPVRIGNAAAEQLQLDVYGQVVDTLFLARQAGLGAEVDVWRLQRALLDHLESNWRQPDEGLWEVRCERRHFVHSKVMAWVAMDRAVRTVEAGDYPGPVKRWRALRDEIHREVCTRGYDTERGTFTRSYGSRELDAATLVIPRVGFLPPDDPRVVGTVTTIARELEHGGLVRRYADPVDIAVDGVPGTEGAFIACSFWLANALHTIGEHTAGRDLFERVLDLRNDVGLLAEEWDPVTGQQVGNFPQAYSHIDLINTACVLSGHEVTPAQ
ncbi:glucoamylase [Wenjunlia vitaminophila]|uniref:Trehalase n=1 Tax=Wenjunlia vitaminophila TaxID=76728 RepID=A0A0T6LTM4_WENVI|nr:glycoside hydrolase family 15 protein [Wenjunlia vitaminophila]KRV49305.1 glucoamylase [Wenjunlia vitaminophila]